MKAFMEANAKAVMMWMEVGEEGKEKIRNQ